VVGRGFATVLILILFALACLAGSRRIGRDRRLVAKLRAARAFDSDSGVPLGELTPDQRDSARSLAAAGVLAIRRNRCFIVQSQLSMFRYRRTRATLAAGFVALAVAVLVAILILRR